MTMPPFDMPGHENHSHGPIDPELFEKLMKDVKDAKPIDNLFLIPIGNPSRFVMAQVDGQTGDITTLGYIPFDFMLDVGVGFIQAVNNIVQQNTALAEIEDEEPPDAPLAGGLFKVI